jgi:hypothetical protein
MKRSASGQAKVKVDFTNANVNWWEVVPDIAEYLDQDRNDREWVSSVLALSPLSDTSCVFL